MSGNTSKNRKIEITIIRMLPNGYFRMRYGGRFLRAARAGAAGGWPPACGAREGVRPGLSAVDQVITSAAYIVGSVLAIMLFGALQRRMFGASNEYVAALIATFAASLFLAIQLYLQGALGFMVDLGVLPHPSPVLAFIVAWVAGWAFCYCLAKLISARSIDRWRHAVAIRPKDTDVFASRIDPMLAQHLSNINAIAELVEGNLKRDAADRQTETLDRLAELMGSLRGEIQDAQADIAECLKALKRHGNMLETIRGATAQIKLLLDTVRSNTASLSAIIVLLGPDEPGPAGPAGPIAMLQADGIDPAKITKGQAVGVVVRSLKAHKIRAGSDSSKAGPDITVFDESYRQRRAVVAVETVNIPYGDKRGTRKVTRKRYAPTLCAAKMFKVPFVLHVTNTANGRVWMSVVPANELSGLGDTDTPHILARSDDDSGKTLKAHNSDALVSLGGLA